MKILSLSASLVLVLAATPPAAAQTCFGPDNLNAAPCCAPVQLSIPSFPPFAMTGQGDRWDFCGLAVQNCITIDVAPPVPTAVCGTYTAFIRILDCAGTPLMEGNMTLDYTRTWDESTSGVTPEYQVWRMLAKVDLRLVPGAPIVTPVPNSLGGGAQWAFFYGYVDYVLECSTGLWEPAIALYHGCDDFQHMPIYSQFPGVFDPVSSYAIVGPDLITNPFVPSPAPLPGGPLIGEAIRPTDSPIPGLCVAEDFVAGGQVQPIISACLCPLSLVPPQQTVARIEATGFCGNDVRALNFWPTLPWFFAVSTSLGSWSNASSYPGPERISVVEGLFLHQDTCDPTGIVELSFDVNYGAVTEGGLIVFPNPIFAPSQIFLDMASNYSLQVGTPAFFPVVGTVYPTRHLTYVNL